jgi:hypothetical protein
MIALLRKIYESVDPVLDAPREVTILRATLLMLLLDRWVGGFAHAAIAALCAVVLLSKDLTISRRVWIGVLAVLTPGLLAGWWTNDNHKFLIFYWVLACVLALGTTAPAKFLAINGRALIGLAFGFATAWKFIGGEYLSGKFFTYELLFDERFKSFASLAAGLPAQASAYNQGALEMLRTVADPSVVVTVASAPAIANTALALSLMTIGIEAAVAISFLLAWLRGHSEMADNVLLSFIVLTYTLVPVYSFGAILAVMGLAQCPAENRDSRRGFVWAFVIVQLSRLRSPDVLASLLS